MLVCAFAAAVSAPAVVAPLAAAQDDEVFVDPGSPSGKEYELPIDRARQQAGSTKKQSGSQKAPLFGEGVRGGASKSGQAQRRDQPVGGSDKGSKDTASKARSKRAKERAAAARKAQAAKPWEVAEDAAAAEVSARELRAQAAAPEGGTGLAAIIAAGIAVVLIGGLVGLWLRRRSAA